jgi:FtsP/CotA-like multicopper oxidase with cupredoxin domain
MDSFSLHGHHFRLLDRLDGWKPYWLDTLVVAGRQTARIAFAADNPGRFRRGELVSGQLRSTPRFIGA